MKKPDRFPRDPSLFHILIGRPDEDCEVCRAHGLNAHELPEGTPGMVVLNLGSLDEILRCPCPLCRQLDPGHAAEPEPGRDSDDPRDP